MVSTTTQIPPKIFFHPTPTSQDPHYTGTRFYESTPPQEILIKIKNPAKWGYSSAETTYRSYLFFEYLESFSYLYITTKRGSGDNQIQKGGYTDSYGKDIRKLFKEGGFPHARPPPSSTGNACLRTHPRPWPRHPKSKRPNLL
jgi:hypothetical protein